MFKLADYKSNKYYKKNYIKIIIWEIISLVYFNTSLPGNFFRIILLKALGAKIGKNVVIKPNVKIKYPWILNIGNNSWIGEYVWIDNISNVKIGSNTCISQGAYICSASHNYKNKNFELLLQPVEIGDNCWITAKCIIGPNVSIPSGTVIKMGEKITSKF